MGPKAPGDIKLRPRCRYQVAWLLSAAATVSRDGLCDYSSLACTLYPYKLALITFKARRTGCPVCLFSCFKRDLHTELLNVAYISGLVPAPPPLIRLRYTALNLHLISFWWSDVTVIYGHDYDLHVVGHDVVLCEVNWWGFLALYK